MLLQTACGKFKREGLTVAEAYPTVNFPELPYNLPMSARNYHGPLSMYLKQGFHLHRKINNWAVVRKSLRSCCKKERYAPLP